MVICRTILTLEAKKQMVKLHNQGIPLYKLAKMFRCGYDKVKGAFAEYESGAFSLDDSQDQTLDLVLQDLSPYAPNPPATPSPLDLLREEVKQLKNMFQMQVQILADRIDKLDMPSAQGSGKSVESAVKDTLRQIFDRLLSKIWE